VFQSVYSAETFTIEVLSTEICGFGKKLRAVTARVAAGIIRRCRSGKLASRRRAAPAQAC
jgi:hypothetical protein